MEHKDFVVRAIETARIAGGVRSLARHVRLLYSEIRRLQNDDNAFFYMAEVISNARDDKLDVAMIAERIRVYHHRDRKACGDKPVDRSMPPRYEAPDPVTSPETIDAGEGQQKPREARVSDGPAAVTMAVLASTAHESNTPDLSQAQVALPMEAAPPCTQSGLEQRRALTVGIHRRRGRRVVEGGG